MSQGTPNDSDLVNFRVVSEEEYRTNLKRAEEAQAQLDHFKAMNEAAKKAYDKQQELLRKILEGKEAERQLQSFAGTSGSAPLTLAGSTGQTNPPPTPRWHPTNAQQVHGPSYHAAQTANQASGSSHRDTLRYSHYRPAQQPQTSKLVYAQNHVQTQQPQTSQAVHTQNHLQSQQNSASRPSTSRFTRQQVPVQPGRQALTMQPVVSAVSQSSSVASHSISAQHGSQSCFHTPSGQGSAIPNFVTSWGVQQHPAPPPSASSLHEDLNAVRTTKASQTAPPTAVPLPKVSIKQNGTDLGATAAKLQAHLVNKAPSQSNQVPVPPATGSSSQQVDSPVDIKPSWQRFSQSIVSWANTASPQSEMPLVNTKIKVVKDANSQVFITIPGTAGLNPITVTLQALLASTHFSSNRTSSDQNITIGPLNKSNTLDSRSEYRPYSVPQHQALQVGSGAASVSSNIGENTITLASIACPSMPTKTKTPATPSSSERTPSQADKKSLARDILRALSNTSSKRSQPEEASVMQVPEPPAKRHASGLMSPTSEGLDVIPQVPIKNIQRSSPTAGTDPLQAPKLGQTLIPSASTDFEPSVSSAISTESALLQTSNSLATGRQLNCSSIQATPENLPSDNDDQRSVDKIVFPERPKTPLFLPSPSSSPAAEIRDSTRDVLANHNHNVLRRARQPAQPFYISVPSDPLWLQQHKARQLRSKGRRLVDESERQSSSGGIMGGVGTSLGGDRGAEESNGQSIEDEDNDIIDLDPANDLATDEFEREAILLSCSRLREQRCKWNNCRIVLNSTEKLIRHLAYAHQEIFEEFSVCRWQHCRQPAVNWAKLFRHLKGHALVPLQCAYQDCEESFRTPRQLVKHHRAEHHNDSPKPSDTPFSPILNTPPDASPPVLPSYLMEPIQRPSMFKERHNNLGPWVLRQIAGPVNHEVKRYNAASKLLQSPSRSDKQDYHPYEFLSFPSTNYSSAPSMPSKIRGMEDLISGEVSNMVHNGLVLWDLREEESEDELSLPSSPLLQSHSDGGASTEEQLDVDRVQIMLGN